MYKKGEMQIVKLTGIYGTMGGQKPSDILQRDMEPSVKESAIISDFPIFKDEKHMTRALKTTLSIENSADYADTYDCLEVDGARLEQYIKEQHPAIYEAKKK